MPDSFFALVEPLLQEVDRNKPSCGRAILMVLAQLVGLSLTMALGSASYDKVAAWNDTIMVSAPLHQKLWPASSNAFSGQFLRSPTLQQSSSLQGLKSVHTRSASAGQVEKGTETSAVEMPQGFEGSSANASPYYRRDILGTSLSVASTIASQASVRAAKAESQDENPNTLTRRGMAKFKRGDVDGSIEDFDKVMRVAPKMTPYLWQRGLSLYYANRFEDGAVQFRRDVSVNPNDTEEAIWTYLCEARTIGPEKAREKLLRVGPDPRNVMGNVYALFSGDGSVAKLAAAGNANASDKFYSLLYIGLWHEAQGEVDDAKKNILAAVNTAYGQRSDDYMAALAAVHAKRRGWLQ